MRRTTLIGLAAACALLTAVPAVLAVDDHPGASDVAAQRAAAPAQAAPGATTAQAATTRARAAAIAKARFPRHTVVRITRDNAYGARWEVKMRRGEAEVEVYVSSAGRIVKVVRG